MKWLGVIFAIFASICGLGIGCSVPANAVVSNVKQNFAKVPVWREDYSGHE